ncbi:Endothelin-converting enzyme 1, partial [Termitomyces sp. J132]
LLQNPEADRTNDASNPTFSERAEAIAREPLTPLTKILLVLALVLLLSTSVFIGLFAGVQHKLNLERSRNRDGERPPHATFTTTAITTSTAISTQTTTAISTQTTSITTTATRTEIITPAPGPTAPPKEVSPYAVFNDMNINTTHKEICLTPQCILLSGSILSSLDTFQDPCEKFYDFATGGWLRAHPLPADKSSYGNFEAVAERNRQVIQRILESNTDKSSFERSPDQQIMRKLRDFYASCISEDTLDDLGTIPLLDFVKALRRKFRGLKNPSSKESIDLTAALAFLHSQGVEALFSFEIEGDVGRDPNDMTLWFSQPSLGLPSKEYYDDKAILDGYKQAIERLLLTLSEEDDQLRDVETSESVTIQESDVWPPWPWPPWDEDDDDKGGDKKPTNRTERVHKIAQKIITLEKRLAEASLDLDVLVQNPIATYNPLPLSNLTDTLPQIDFPEYFAAFTPRNFPSIVIQTYPAYASSLAEILDKTSKDVLEAYLIVRAALALAPHLGLRTEAWQAQRSLYELLNGIKKGVVGDRSEYCIEKVEESLGFAVGRYFVNETFAGDSKEKGTQIITDIVKAFKASLPHIDWMDKKSGKAAAEKADAIRVKVGYPVSPDTEDASSIAQYYNLVNVDKVNFFNNIISAVKSDQYKKWQQLGKRRNQDIWLMFPSTVNAYFDPPANEIVFPAGILQPPFFDASWPSYISYGAFGHVAAHELTHAFDSAGRLYNQDGKLEEWWTNSTSEGFRVKQKCIVDQFSAYTIDDGKGGKVHVNGNLTSGENIGDTGLIQAYRAWKAQYDSSLQAGHEFLLPGLPYTREQLFFISFARVWARAMKTAAALQRIRTDPHSPTRFRVDGTVYNIPEFAQAFNCSKKAKVCTCLEFNNHGVDLNGL